MKNLKELLVLKNLPKVGNSKINNDLKGLLTSDTNIEVLADRLKKKGFSEFNINEAISIAKIVADQIESSEGYTAITIFDDVYPESLKDLGSNMPVILYAMGNLDALAMPSLGIIGTRHPDEHVVKYAPKMISLAIEKIHPAIVSGLAIGCDTIGHKTALEQNAKTIAVLPSGFNTLTKAKRNLCNEIIENGGLILSEYTPDTEETRFTPVQRDAIVAALSEKLISLQCGLKSGTMHTVEAAYKMHRPIGCYMPSKMEGDFAGHNEAIRRFSASALSSAEDLEKFLELKVDVPEENEQISLF